MAISIIREYLAAFLLLIALPASSQPAGVERMKEEFSIEQRIPVKASPDDVWRVLVSPESIEEWLGVKAISDWRVGSSIDFVFDYQGKSFNDKGRILAFAPGREFAYSYWSAFSGLPDSPENYSEIRFAIASDERGAVLVLSHTKIATRTMYEHSQANWAETLAVIKNLAEK